MTDFPAAGYLSDSERVNSEALAAFEAWLAATKQLPGGRASTTFTLSSGVVTPDRSIFLVDTEGGAASDDLDRIAVTNLPDGSYIEVQTVDSSRKVTVKHAAGGSGQIVLDDSADFQLASRTMSLRLYRDGTQWRELGRSHGTQQALGRAWLGLADLATRTFASLRPVYSGEFTVSSGGKDEWEHALGELPARFWATLRCAEADAGYGVNDVLALDGGFLSSSPRAVTLWATDTKVGWVASNAGTPLMAVNYSTGAAVTLTLSKWRLRLFASLL